MQRPAKIILAALAATLATGACLVTPASTAGTYVDPCTQNPELIITSRQYLGHTFSMIRSFTRYCQVRHDNAVLDMQQAAGSAWSVNYIASRAKRDMIQRMYAYIGRIDAMTDDLTLNHYDDCPSLFNMNLNFNNASPGILSYYVANFRDQLDGAVATYAIGPAADDPSVRPGTRGGSFGGGLTR